jgi:hypothetical protein
VAAAAAALVRAVEDQYGLASVDRIVLTRSWVGAIYVDESDRSFVRWRTEDEAARGIIPSTSKRQTSKQQTKRQTNKRSTEQTVNRAKQSTSKPKGENNMSPLISFSSEISRYGTRIDKEEPAGGSLHGGLKQHFENNRGQPVDTTSHEACQEASER